MNKLQQARLKSSKLFNMHILIAALHRPSKPTGVCRYAVNLAQCLAEINQVTKVSLVIGAWQKSYFQQSFKLSSDKIDLISVDIKNTSSSRNIWFLFTLPKLAKQLNADIVHLSFPLPFIRQLFTCPVVATIHDLYPYEFPENFGYPNVIFNQLFLKVCINNSDGLSCVSKTTLESLKQYFNKIETTKHTAVIYNQADFSNINDKISLKLTNIINNFPFILAVGQHRKNKNLDMIIKSYHSLKASNQIHESTKLIIVGSSGPETENLNQLRSALSHLSDVEMLASIDDEELCWLYKNCQMLVIPSTTEGFCLPLAEALSVGAKVVCSDIPIFREIGNSSCTYFQLKGDGIQNLSQAIIDSLAQPTQIVHPDNRFSKVQLSQQYINLYSQIKL